MIATKQEAYDKIVEHFSKPDAVLGRDEFTGNGVSRRKSDPASPVRCAAGCLIPDEKYQAAFEGHGAHSERVVNAYTISFEVAHFVRDCQELHDKAAKFGGTVEFFLRELFEFARISGLEVRS